MQSESGFLYSPRDLFLDEFMMRILVLSEGPLVFELQTVAQNPKGFNA